MLNHSRKKRISAGAGVKVEQINQLLTQFEMMQTPIKQMNNAGKKKGKKFKGMPNMGGFGGGRGGFNIPGF